MNKFCAFDIEIVKEIPEGCSDWKTIRPLGISCAATILSGQPRPTLWFRGQYGKEPLSGAMEKEEVEELLDFLLIANDNGYIPLTWNGLGFDFDVLAEESGMPDICKELALSHIDMMFHFFCIKGFPLGLNTAAHALGLQGKTEGMHGDLAPAMWAKGVDERNKVLEYVGQDAVTTLQVAEEAQKQGGINWHAKSGRLNTFRLFDWLTVKDALNLPLPDTSWMTTPRLRADFYGWTGYEPES